MTLEILRSFFGWCLLMNVALIVWWALFVLFAPDWMYKMHGRFFKGLARESFDAIHYAGLAFFKIIVFVFCLVPYLTLLILTCGCE
ncbi:MAG: hypothetical protein DRP71_12400 [Verrucomicrobia bacterium]|nr:MAG: hypothetical protein DRP71_12400 [Verrucomicrobiota bacterium]